MRRRDFIAGLASAATWSPGVRAQPSPMPVIGFLNSGMRSDADVALSGFRQGLHEAGFIEGQNVAIEQRWAENEIDRLPALAEELAQRRVTVIAASPNPQSVAAAKAATATIPIIFLSGGDPVLAKLVASLNRPGGNATGVTLLSPDLTGKRLGLLHQLAPQATAIAVLLDKRNGIYPQSINEAGSAGRSIGARIIPVWAESDGDFDPAFASAVRDGAHALLVDPSINHRARLVSLAARYRLPAIYQMREYADAGGLMSYGPSSPEAYRQVGVYTGRVLKGEKPADLPVMLPTRFELVINLQAAKSQGIDVPPTLLALADAVIE
jgi:putative tryptophan/tyrosine transport system substrate-binding protein